MRVEHFKPFNHLSKLWPNGFITFDSWELAYMRYKGITYSLDAGKFNTDFLDTDDAKTFMIAYDMGWSDATEAYY